MCKLQCEELRAKDRRIANLRSLLARERYFHRAWKTVNRRHELVRVHIDGQLARDIDRLAARAAERDRRDK